MLKKSLSQHLLKEQNILKKMLSRTDITKDDTVLEIGAGTGELTALLKNVAGKVYAVEIDKSFSQYLDEIASKNENVEVIYGDFLKVDLSVLVAENPIKVMGNIPYGITGPILFKIFKDRNYIRSAFLTVQREVAERIVAKPRSRSYGGLSVISQVLANVRIEFFLPSQIFIPPPQIESAFVSFVFREESKKISPNFFSFVRSCFKHRRKLLLNSLRSSYRPCIIESLFEKMKLEKSVRAEELPPERFVEMFSLIESIDE